MSAVFGAMFAVTGTVFSIPIVALSVTSRQFGPRLLRGFMYDLPSMAKHVTRAGDRTALRRHVERVLRHGESLHEEDDRLELSTRFDALVKTLNG